MEYTISKLAKISGVTTRTLRYYDDIEEGAAEFLYEALKTYCK